MFLVIEPQVDDEAEESVRLRRALRDLRLPADMSVAVTPRTGPTFAAA